MVARCANSKHDGAVCRNLLFRNPLTGLTELVKRESVNDSHSGLTRIHGNVFFDFRGIKCEGNSSCGAQKSLDYSFRNRIFRRLIFGLLFQIGTSCLNQLQTRAWLLTQILYRLILPTILIVEDHCWIGRDTSYLIRSILLSQEMAQALF